MTTIIIIMHIKYHHSQFHFDPGPNKLLAWGPFGFTPNGAPPPPLGIKPGWPLLKGSAAFAGPLDPSGPLPLYYYYYCILGFIDWWLLIC